MEDAIKTASEVMAKAKENFDAIGESALDGNVNADALVQVCARMSSRLDEALNELAVAQLADETETEPGSVDTTLRRALESIVGLEKTMDESISKAGYQTGGEAGSYFYKAIVIARKALGGLDGTPGSPQRNCDRYRDYDSARKAWDEHWQNYSSNVFTCLDEKERNPFGRWLLQPVETGS